MKKRIIILILSVLLKNVSAVNYYWNPDFISGNINWTDLNNWYTVSGGSVHPVSLPGPADDIYIDSNSSYPVMALDDTAVCHSVFISGALTGIPEINDMGFYSMHVYGSFYGHDSLIINTAIYFMSGATGNQIDLYAPFNGAFDNLSVYFSGTGEWTLADNLIANVISVENGTLKSNDKQVTSKSFLIQGNLNRTVLLGQSVVECIDAGSGFFVTGSNYIIDADSASIILTVGDNIVLAFDGGINQHYHYVEMDTLAPVAGIAGSECEIDHLVCYGAIQDLLMTGTIHKAEFFGGGSIGDASSGNIVYDTLILDNTVPGGLGPNYYYTIETDSLFVNDLITVNSGIADTISIIAAMPNILVLPSDTICLDYIKLENSNAVGSGYYFAGNNSIDLGSNSGWTFTNCNFGSVGIISFETQKIKIFPNPSSSLFMVNAEEKINSVRVFNLSGQCTNAEIIKNSEEQIIISLEELPTGLYLIELFTDKGIIREKIAKK